MESAENQSQPISGQESATKDNQPLSKTETIALLNDSIDRLEDTIKRISEESAKIPPSESINNVITTTQELEDAVTPINAPVADSSPPNQPPDAQAVESKTSQTKTSPTTPTKANKNKNLGLIVIGITAIAITVVTVFWLWKPQAITNLFPPAQPKPTEVVADLDLSSEPSLETSETPVTKAPNFAPSIDQAIEFPESIELATEPIEDVVETIIPPELTSPGREKNLKMVTIKPKLNFSPEQNLVAALETKVEELVKAYPSAVIQDIKINLPQSSLLVRVTNDWYELEEERQNSLGNSILQGSRAFSFNKLELKDPLGTLVARSPVIGNNIIVVKNLQDKEQPKSAEN